MSRFELHLGDCLETLRTMPDNSVDSIVTDPPYGLAFMGKKWDYDVPSVEIWVECLRVLKPGGHLLAFAGTRTQHRMAVRIEDAGFEIRDMIAWLYGSGFNKVGYIRGADGEHVLPGFGGSLKPAMEPITVARKPLQGTLAANLLVYGTGGLNVDGCRVATNDGNDRSRPPRTAGGNSGNWKDWSGSESQHCAAGRWPANVIHDGSEEVLAGFPVTGPAKAARRGVQQRHDVASPGTARPKEGTNTVRGHDDIGGSAARFFYCAKASKRDRDEGLKGFELRKAGALNMRTDAHSEANGMTTANRANTHPTVKPTDLMAYLVRLVTPPGGTVLDPFMGSGSTGKAAMREGLRFIGCEMSPEYLEIARARIESAITVL